MAANVRATTLVTLPQARQWCLNDAHDASRDDLLALAADAASERLERDTSRVFRRRTLTERANGDSATGVWYLRRFPIISVTSVTMNGLALPAEQYVVDAEAGRLLLTNGATFAAGVQNLVAVYDAGYDDAALPADAVELALQLTARIFKLRTTGGQTFDHATVGPHAFSVRDSLPTDLVRAIERLRDKRFG